MSGLRRRSVVTAGAILASLVVAAALAPVVAALLGTSAYDADLAIRYAPSSWAHPLGTNEIGQDVLLRLLYGARVSLIVGVAAAIASSLLGGVVGVVSGYVGGAVDAALMRVTDMVMAIPVLPLLILLSAIEVPLHGAVFDVARVVLLMTVFGWTTVARLARASALSTKRREFVEAARALGASDRRIVWRHVVPEAVPPVLVATAFEVGANILYEASLSFLGLGVQPPTPSWGNMLTNAIEAIQSDHPALAFWPGLLVLVTVLCATVVGDGLREALDPRAEMRKRP